ncbi:MAG: hypothetical protein ACOCWJ_05820 [Verrucomicrobiota bacterium]
MIELQQYSRWHREFAQDSNVTAVQFLGPASQTTTRPTFSHQPTRFAYDRHGYETIEIDGPIRPAVRFTPTSEGDYSWSAVTESGATVESGILRVTPAEHPGYVQVSTLDSRYFAFTNGDSYCPVGINVCWPVYYELSKGTEFETTAARATLGVEDFRRWFEALAAAGGNFTRIWCSAPALNTETERASVLDLSQFARLDAIVEMARQYDIRLKLCLEHFRTIEPGSPYHAFRRTHPAFGKEIHAPDGAPGPANIQEWFTSPRWRDLWLKKVDAYTARYGDDPTVMCWELWNEINACKVSDWAAPRDWTQAMLPELKKRSPRNLVVNSLGSFDSENKVPNYTDFHMDEMEFQQVHRYLDQGASLAVCHTDPVELSRDAVRRTRRPDRPILLAETGAVNDNHTGQFRYYRVDHAGLLLHDFIFAPFFEGAAGCGHSWFWEHYIEPHNLWHQIKPMRELVDGVQLDAEGFQPVDLSTDQAWLLALAGKSHILLWARNRADRWDHVLRDNIAPAPVPTIRLDLSDLGLQNGSATLINTWSEDGCTSANPLPVSNGILPLPSFTHGRAARIRRN